MISRNRARILTVVALIIGLCILAAGITGRVVMGKIAEEVMSSDYVGSISESMPELGRIANRYMGRVALRLTVSLIRNDPSGFVNVMKDITKAVGSMAGASGIVDLFMGSFIEEAALEAFEEGRQEMIRSAGAQLPLLQFAAYYSELLWIGGILAGVALILLFVTGGATGSNQISGRMRPVLAQRNRRTVYYEL